MSHTYTNGQPDDKVIKEDKSGDQSGDQSGDHGEGWFREPAQMMEAVGVAW